MSLNSRAAVNLSLISLAVLSPLKLPGVSLADVQDSTIPKVGSPAVINKFHGWDRVVEKLGKLGVPRPELERVFCDPRMPNADEVRFKMRTPEPEAWYAQFRDSAHVARGVAFVNEHQQLLSSAASRFSVRPSVVAAQFVIESDCGARMGDSLVVQVLARMAAADSPTAITNNFERLREDNPNLKISQVHERGSKIAHGATLQLKALFDLGRAGIVDVLSVKGSRSGAIGPGQFMPGTWLTHRLDASGAGVPSPFNLTDVVYTMGNMHHKNGWREGLSRKHELRVLRHYNQSGAYGRAVLDLAALIDHQLEMERRRS